MIDIILTTLTIIATTVKRSAKMQSTGRVLLTVCDIRPKTQTPKTFLPVLRSVLGVKSGVTIQKRDFCSQAVNLADCLDYQAKKGVGLITSVTNIPIERIKNASARH